MFHASWGVCGLSRGVIRISLFKISFSYNLLRYFNTYCIWTSIFIFFKLPKKEKIKMYSVWDVTRTLQSIITYVIPSVFILLQSSLLWPAIVREGGRRIFQAKPRDCFNILLNFWYLSAACHHVHIQHSSFPLLLHGFLFMLSVATAIMSVVQLL